MSRAVDWLAIRQFFELEWNILIFLFAWWVILPHITISTDWVAAAVNDNISKTGFKYVSEWMWCVFVYHLVDNS